MDLTDPVRELQTKIRLPGNCRDARRRSRPGWRNRCAGTGKRRRPAPTGRGKDGGKRRKGRGPRRRNPDLHRREVRTPLECAPEGSEHRGWQAHTVRDIVFHAGEVTWLREVRRFPDGTRHVAPLPPGVARGRGQYGPGARAPAIMLYRQCQSTKGRITALLNDIGLDISARRAMRFPTDDAGVVADEQREVLRAGMETARWINVDDTGARHRAVNGYCTVVGNDVLTHFRSTGPQSRPTFFDHLRAVGEAHTVNDAALDFMRRMGLPGRALSRLMSHRRRRLADGEEWRAHPAELGVDRMKGRPDPVRVATEGAVRSTVAGAGRIAGTVITGDDAGQFNAGDAHAPVRVHAERTVRKQRGSDEFRRTRVDAVPGDVRDFYRDLSACRQAPRDGRRRELSARFDRIFGRRTGYTGIDDLLWRLSKNRAELPPVLDWPATPLNTNGAERDIRAQVTQRKISPLSLRIASPGL